MSEYFKDTMRDSFKNLLIHIGLPNKWVDDQIALVFARYQEKHRAYHNLNHLQHFFKLYQSYESQIGQKELFQLAIWYHDLIYDVPSDNNELKSALFFRDGYAPYLENEALDTVFSIIESTHKHIPLITSNDNALFLDMDLSILGEEQSVYQQYTQQIEKEYTSYYELAEYRAGRFVAMKTFLDRERIFYTDCFYEQYEQRARENIQFELNEIRKKLT